MTAQRFTPARWSGYSVWSNDMTSVQKPVTREELYEQVWRKPMLKLAQHYGVSSTHLANVCTELRVPRPERGYWSKLEFGKPPPKPALPPARPGDQTEWKAGIPLGTAHRATAVRKRREGRPLGPSPAGKGTPAQEQRHDLVVQAKPHFLKSRKPDDTGHLRPFKRHLVDIVVSERMLDSALEAADTLFRALTKAGHRVLLAETGFHWRRTEFDIREAPRKQGYIRHAWSPDQATVVLIGDVSIGLTVFEMTEFVELVKVGADKYAAVRDLTPEQDLRFARLNYWRTTRELPSRRLALQAYSAAWRAPWARRWPETKQGEFASFVPGVVKELESIAPELARRKQEADRKAEEERREWECQREVERQEAERARKVKARQDARQDLLAAIESWEQVRSIHGFFQAAQEQLAQLPESERAQLTGRLTEARSLVGEVDALEKLRKWKSPEER